MNGSRRILSTPSCVALALCAGVAWLSAARPAMAADCWGGTARRVSVGAREVSYRGTVTLPGGSHESLIGPDGLTVQVVDADDAGTVLFTTTIPRARFRSTATTTRYDRTGPLNGRVTLRNAKSQADTVEIDLRAFGLFDPSGRASDAVRVVVRSGKTCASSCVSSCGARAGDGPLKCRKSAIYQPFADQGFGALTSEAARKPGARSSLCGLTIRTSGPRCDFLIDERCILPYPSRRSSSTRTPRRRPGCASTMTRTRCRRTPAASTSIRPTGTRSTASARDR
jgi:hypothetical protein